MTANCTVLGLDIGGSKTHGLLSQEGSATRQLVAGSANVSSVGLDRAALALDDLAAQLGTVAVDAICAGAAGADTPQGRARLSRLLSQRFPGARVEVVHDTRIILAAAGLQVGAVVISGTGSAGWARRADGQEARAGGWGYLLGDEGSGYAVTRDAVRVALDEVDDGRQQSPLTTRLLHDCGLGDPWQLLDRFYEQPERRYWAGLAGGVLDLAEQDDPVAVRIVERAAGALADLATTVTRRLGLAGPVVLAGGLVVHQPLLAGQVRRLLAGRGLPDVRVLDHDPAHGAVELARQLLVPNHATTPKEHR